MSKSPPNFYYIYRIFINRIYNYINNFEKNNKM